ncbi:periplasmic nitrate reductase, NapE protein [compost metagenome]
MRTAPDDKLSKGKETRLFLFLVICLFPLLSIALVGGFGFFIWFMQMLLGPPGPPN